MISTRRTILSIAIVFVCVVSSNLLSAQQPKFISLLREVSKKMSFESASIKINNKDVSYADVLKIPDSALLKIEVYSKKEAMKIFGKEEGKNGVLLITLRKGEMFQYDIDKPCSHLLINNNGDTIYCEHLTTATLGGDTTNKNWTQFLIKHLNSNAPVDNGCPPGIYYVDFSFIVNKDGSVAEVKIFEDPG